MLVCVSACAEAVSKSGESRGRAATEGCVGATEVAEEETSPGAAHGGIVIPAASQVRLPSAAKDPSLHGTGRPRGRRLH